MQSGALACQTLASAPTNNALLCRCTSFPGAHDEPAPRQGFQIPSRLDLVLFAH
jgi:hypothetical protein